MATDTDSKKPVGLRTIVRAELKMRGIHTKDTKAPQAVPNRKASKKLEARRRGFASDSTGKSTAHQRTQPGSYNRKRG